VHIFSRNGEQVCDVLLSSKAQCIALEWDKDGEAVCILQAGVDAVAVWEVASRSVLYVDTGLKDPTFARWSKVGPQLAIGSSKGALVIFRKDTRKKVLVTGKHGKAIVCGDWSADNHLALGGADVQLTISNAEGDTQEQIELKFAPVAIQYATEKSDGSHAAGSADTTVSVNMGGNTVLLYNLTRPTEPSELLFQPRYGRIVAYRWFGDGYMMLGFSEGYVVVVSTHRDEIKEEVFSGRFHREPLADIACSMAAKRAASAGGNTIRLLDMAVWREVKSEYATVEPAHGPIESLAWTQDGQILTAATRSGHVYAFLGKIPTVVDACAGRVAYMSSLREVAVAECGADAPLLRFPVALEPGFVALGPRHAAVGMNNKVWVHRLGDRTPGALVAQRDYMGSVDAVFLGDAHIAALCGSKLFLSAIEPPPGGAAPTKVLPERDDGSRVTAAAIAGDFLYVGLSTGMVELFSLADWRTVPSAEYRAGSASGGGGGGSGGSSSSGGAGGVTVSAAGSPVRAVYPNALGTRAVVLHANGAGVLFNPVTCAALAISDLPRAGVNRVMWDARDSGTFVVAADATLLTYLYVPVSLSGATVSQLGTLDIRENGDMTMEAAATPLPSGQVPLAVADGVVTTYSQAGTLASVYLVTHDALATGGAMSPTRMRAALAQYLGLLRLNEAWDAATRLDDRSCWMALSGKAMEILDLEMAQRVYRRVGDAGMVAALAAIARLEDRAAIAGHIALAFGDFPLAQELLLASSTPLVALDMRKDLLQWDTALKLAETLAPAQVPAISLEAAKQLEFKGEYGAAYEMYTTASRRADALAAASGGAAAAAAAGLDVARLRSVVGAGIARMTLRQGDIRKGVALAADSGDKQLCRECAAILERYVGWVVRGTHGGDNGYKFNNTHHPPPLFAA